MSEVLEQTSLEKVLNRFRNAAASEREKGTYFEELIVAYLKHEPFYADLYSQVWTFRDWAVSHGKDGTDKGIDLVAQTKKGELHAIQCKFYAPDHKIEKRDIDSFMAASGQRPFVNRFIICTTNHWGNNAEAMLENQQIPVSKIDLAALEQSVIDWEKYAPDKALVIHDKKKLRPHQETAVKNVLKGLETADRGKLIMACGTGKTFTSLKIAEAQAGKGKRVLFLVPSLALLSQTLTEWTQQSETKLHSFAVCSDAEVGKKRDRKDDDSVQTFVHELQYPATTDAKRLAEEMIAWYEENAMSVIFSTYHSIDVISQAQKNYDLPAFDLVICDEAHRTTGQTYEGDEESAFVRVHNNDFIKAAKRLYMTATPRIFSDDAKRKAETEKIQPYSMNNPDFYGKDLYVLTFSEAVERGLLVDYKVILLSVEERLINRRLQNLLKDENNELRVDDATKIIGCWKALSKQDSSESLQGDVSPMQRAVAFCQVIDRKKSNKVGSLQIASMFQAVVEEYQRTATDEEETSVKLHCEARHVDGGMNASEKEEKIQWLRSPAPKDTCRILSNVRCLSEGVDVPALDAVLFLTARNSQVDVVQSVGRVMRNAPGKTRGYIVLPVVIPSGVEPHEALNDNKTYKVVWQVLQALRSHDDQFDAMINKIALNGVDPQKMEVIAVTDLGKRRKKVMKEATGLAKRQYNLGKAQPASDAAEEHQGEFVFEVTEFERAIIAKVVEKVGNRHQWEELANGIAQIARTHIDRIKAILENPENTKAIATFREFSAELKDDLNDALTDDEIIEMLAQHLITKPVFDALFSDYSFTAHNPMSQAIQKVLDVLSEFNINKESTSLDEFYHNVAMRAGGINSAEGRQKLVVELYDKFFRNAFPKMTERLGIVYTPVEVVDFILHSVNDVLKAEFNQSLGSEGVHILDPFTGTGTFITRLMQSGLIAKQDLPRVYKHQLHANELVLLAYYIAAVNIESAYHALVGGDYEPFSGILLTDTFQMSEKGDLIDNILVDNSQRRKDQMALDIKVIVGNPPYSVGQKSENDNNQNLSYLKLDQRIADTYEKFSNAKLRTSLYDSYIRAIRWASDRIGEAGVIGFVTNAGYIESSSADGLRKCLAEEFSNIYIFHLRGNQRTSGERSRKEGGKIFGSGSRAPIAISILVKNPASKQHGKIFFHDIGDYLTTEQKLEKLADLTSISGLKGQWQLIIPDAHNDWVNQRDDSFNEFIAIGDKKVKTSITIFDNYSSGVKTNRDAWAYNFSKSKLSNNMQSMIDFYNSEINCFNNSNIKELKIDDFINLDTTKISWSGDLKDAFRKQVKGIYSVDKIKSSLYRPFTKEFLYFDKLFNNSIYKIPLIFPNAEAENTVICVSGIGAISAFSSFISNKITCLDAIEKGQCFPMYLYEQESAEEGLFASDDKPKLKRRDAITDAGLQHFQKAYQDNTISKEDLFYYIYGLLHSEDYRTRFADNLMKELPRIPAVKKFDDFKAFSQAGRALANLHLNYETIEQYPATLVTKNKNLEDSDYYVQKMKYGRNGKDKDLSTIIYNDKITIKDIPLEAYDYIVNGKSAIDWVVERQGVKTDKASGIVNDANDWAIETMHNPAYPLELLLRVITVSLETMKIVHNLPKLDI
ncbi:DEAD/DEAH box helicase [Bartonella sp. W8122]|uniref:DEAD/DEAH box helicase n=1 Tax=Bartonella sp. W8122 TaxID=2750930 RepID=UPI0018DBC012|nr:type ISP restriction/modification enzyme [Bartonella sp. W8122]MBI0002177.1 DEAD/DEAH box helicase [Bartonella sp. W8122]